MNDCTHRTTCVLCGSAAIELAIHYNATPIADDYVRADQLAKPQPCYPLGVWLCMDCGHAQLADIVDPKLLYNEGYLYTTSVSKSLVRHFDDYADEMVRRFGLKPGDLHIDIGSNDGTLLKAFQSHGLTCFGVDPSSSVAMAATFRGAYTLPTFFTSIVGNEIRKHGGPAAIVTANNSFAHSTALPDMLDGVREMLASDGVFVFEVSYLLDILRRGLFDVVNHEHVSYHSVAPLVSFMERHGMELCDVERIPEKGGSIRCTARKRTSPPGTWKSVMDALSEEEAFGLATLAPFRQFTRRLAETKASVRGLLASEVHDRCRQVAGFGASCTATTLLYQLEVGDLLSFLVDDNPARHGLHSPGLHLPVLHAEEVLKRGVRTVMVAVPQYADAVLMNHPEYDAAGVGWVVPKLGTA